jgi:hypothetical protein
MPDVSRRLAEALVAVYPARVRDRTAALEPVDGLDDATEAGRRWLEEALGELLARPFARQSRGPLELFQEAMRFPTEALAEAGVGDVARDPVAAHALPGDVYDLAPASTRELGEEVWALHLEWGATKAAAITSGVEPDSPPSPG